MWFSSFSLSLDFFAQKKSFMIVFLGIRITCQNNEEKLVYYLATWHGKYVSDGNDKKKLHRKRCDTQSAYLFPKQKDSQQDAENCYKSFFFVLRTILKMTHICQEEATRKSIWIATCSIEFLYENCQQWIKL